jgi:hypothetical protein
MKFRRALRHHKMGLKRWTTYKESRKKGSVIINENKQHSFNTHESVQQRALLLPKHKRFLESQAQSFCESAGILHKSSGFGVFAKIFSKNIVIPSKEIPFFGEAHQRF